MEPSNSKLAFPRLPWNRWTEALILLTGAGLFMLLADWRAFTAPFFAESFQHLGPYQRLGNCLPCTLITPTVDGWFRPVDAFLTVISFRVLGLNPFMHHLRNYALLLGNLFLLQQILWEMVPGRIAHILPTAFVAVSKVTFTTIGYINNFGGLLEATWILVAILCFVRFIKHGNYWTWATAIVAAALSIFTKETGISVLVALTGLAFSFAPPAAKGPRDLQHWAIYLAPVGLVVAIFFVVRSFVAGGALQTSPVYAPALSFPIIARDGNAFMASLANLAFVEHGVMGNEGLAALLAPRLGWGPSPNDLADALVLAALGALLAVLWWRSGGSPRRWVFPLAWMAVVLGLVITTRNIQLYYTYDFALAFGVLLALLLGGAGRLAGMAATGAVLVVALNGLVSNASSTYVWEQAALDAGQATSRIVALCAAPTQCNHLVLVTSQLGRWQFVLGGVAPGAPMLPDLLGRPGLTVDYEPPSGLYKYRNTVDPTTLYVDIDQGFIRADPAQLGVTGKPSITSFGPAQVRAGIVFNAQAGGLSALWFVTHNATADTIVVFAGTPLGTTVSADRSTVTAVVEPGLYGHPGQYPIYLSNAIGDSNMVELDVLP